MKNQKGFTLVELMVVVAIIAILAAVALPMYSTFKQKAKVSVATKSLEGAKTSLQGWYEDHKSFAAVDTVPADGGSIKAGTRNVGAGLSQVKNMTWSLASATSSELQIDFVWGADAGCPNANCDGKWKIRCYADNDLCIVGQQIGDGSNPLNLDFQPNPALTFN